MPTARGPFLRAGVAMLVLGIYLQAIEWIDLFPWNDIRNGNGQEQLDIALGAGMAILAAMLIAGWRWAAWLSSAALLAWAWLQVSTWWIPYLVGASPGWRRTYERWFSETVQILPSSPDHLPPDASHLLLHVLIVVALATSLIAAVTPRKRA